MTALIGLSIGAFWAFGWWSIGVISLALFDFMLALRWEWKGVFVSLLSNIIIGFFLIGASWISHQQRTFESEHDRLIQGDAIAYILIMSVGAVIWILLISSLIVIARKRYAKIAD